MITSGDPCSFITKVNGEWVPCIIKGAHDTHSTGHSNVHEVNREAGMKSEPNMTWRIEPDVNIQLFAKGGVGVVTMHGSHYFQNVKQFQEWTTRLSEVAIDVEKFQKESRKRG